MSQPTQVRRPWRATLRTIFQGIIAFCVIVPFIVEETHLDPQVYPWLGGILAVAAAITRIMAIPQVEAFLARFLPFLAADPTPAGARRRSQRGAIDALYAAVLVFIGLAILYLVIAIAHQLGS